MKTEHFNGLTEAQAELLAILAEECGETVQMVGKCLRHGLWHDYKTRGQNVLLLQQEVADIFVTVLRLVQEGVLNFDGLDKAMVRKAKKTGHLHHAVPLTDEYIAILKGEAYAPAD